MLRIMEAKEQRVKTILARKKKLGLIQGDIVQAGGDWHKGATMNRWMRAQALQRKCQDELGIIASIYLYQEVA